MIAVILRTNTWNGRTGVSAARLTGVKSGRPVCRPAFRFDSSSQPFYGFFPSESVYNRGCKNENKRTLTAANADKYILYGEAVQTPQDDARFLARYFKTRFRRPLRVLREDFCGTANILTEFVMLHKDNRGIGIDLDPDNVEWCANTTCLAHPGATIRVMLLSKMLIQTRRPRVI